MAKRVIEVVSLRAAHIGIDRNGEVFVHYTGRKPAEPKRKGVNATERSAASRARASGGTNMTLETRRMERRWRGDCQWGWCERYCLENSWKVHRRTKWRRQQYINAVWDMAA